MCFILIRFDFGKFLSAWVTVILLLRPIINRKFYSLLARVLCMRNCLVITFRYCNNSFDRRYGAWVWSLQLFYGSCNLSKLLYQGIPLRRPSSLGS